MVIGEWCVFLEEYGKWGMVCFPGGIWKIGSGVFSWRNMVNREWCVFLQEYGNWGVVCFPEGLW